MLKIILYLIFLFVLVVKESTEKSLIGDAKTPGDDEIVGGKDVDIMQYPYQVSIVYNDDVLYCGGSILSEDYVLTAAHCAPAIKPGVCKIRAGSTFFNKGGTLYDILTVISHPLHKKESRGDYDAAIIKTEKMALNGVTVKTVQLAAAGSNLKPRENMVVTGWGQTANSVDSKILQAVSLPVVESRLCAEIWNDYNKDYKITSRMICAGFEEPGRSACHGDSGGPGVAESSLVQYGIVSFAAPDCATPGIPNVYTSIPAIRDWIKQITGI